MHIETIGNLKAPPAKKSTKETESKDEPPPLLLPSGAEALKMRPRQLNLAEVTRPMNKKELESFMVSTVQRLLKTGKCNLSSLHDPHYLASTSTLYNICIYIYISLIVSPTIQV